MRLNKHSVLVIATSRSLEKGFGMLRRAQHERNNSNDLKISPFVLSFVEGLLEGLLYYLLDKLLRKGDYGWTHKKTKP